MTYPLPDFIDECTWTAFEESRRRNRCPLTDFARKRVINKLQEFHMQGYVADEILAEAIERGWRSVFLWNDAPRRQLNGIEKNNVHQINSMLGQAVKRM
jgi:hypothetical protein